MDLMIVDDEPIIRQGILKMAQMYSPAFAEIFTAENGLDALQKIRNVQPEIVITDIRMPKMDGLELCRVLNLDFPHIQTAVISGYNDFEYAQKCMNYSVKNYLLKPVTTHDVHEVLHKLLNQATLGYIPVSQYVQWIERMEQSIWFMQLDELNVLKKQWREHCLGAKLTFQQMVELLKDCLAELGKRFSERNYKPDLNLNVYRKQGKNVKDVLDQFDQKLQNLADDLLAVRNGNYKDPMEEAKMFIDNQLSQDISLEQVASLVGLTPNYFSAMFKKNTMETFVQYRIRKRMEFAKKLLSIPHYRIVDVALEVGYDDYPHFTKTFKKIIGISPSEFRSQLGIK
jgi:two-component system response regulator YesN